MKKIIKQFIRSCPRLQNIVNEIIIRWKKFNLSKKNHIVNKSLGHLCKDIIGRNNYISIEKGTSLHKLIIHIRGNNNTVKIGKNCRIGEGCSIWAEGNNNTILINNNSTFTCAVHINAQEHDTSIVIDEDCMFSNNIIVRTSDSHPIYSQIDHQRINNPGNIHIGKHVWIAPNTKIMKGAYIADGCIIGSDTTVSKKYEEHNCLIVGRPSKIVKHNVEWTRESLF